MMPSRAVVTSPDRPASVVELSRPGTGEKIVVILILLFPCMGTFFAPETYFATPDFSIESARKPFEFDIPYARLAFELVVSWLFLRFFREPRMLLRGVTCSIIPLIFIGWMAYSATYTGDPSGSLARTLRILTLVLFAMYLVERFDSDEIVALLTLTGAIAITASIAAIILIPTYAYSNLIGYEGAWRGATGHKNTLGGLMAILFLFGYYSIYLKHRIFLLSLFVMTGSLFLIIMSRSATSILVFAAECILICIIGILNSFKTLSEKIFIISAMSIVVCIAICFFHQIDQLLLVLGRDSSFTGRREVWEGVKALIAERPIMGYGHAFWGIDSLERDRVWAELGWAAPHAHNMLLDIRLQLGLVGFAIAALFFAVALWRVVCLISRGVDPSALIWPLILLSFFLRGQSETLLVDPDISGLFWFTLASAGITKCSAQHRQCSDVRTGAHRGIYTPPSNT